jgi:hypothetical protein
MTSQQSRMRLCIFNYKITENSVPSAQRKVTVVVKSRRDHSLATATRINTHFMVVPSGFRRIASTPDVLTNLNTMPDNFFRFCRCFVTRRCILPTGSWWNLWGQLLNFFQDHNSNVLYLPCHICTCLQENGMLQMPVLTQILFFCHHRWVC